LPSEICLIVPNSLFLTLTRRKRRAKLNAITNAEVSFCFPVDAYSRKSLGVVSDLATSIHPYSNSVVLVIVRDDSSIVAWLNVVDLASRVVANYVLTGRVSQRKCALSPRHVLSVNENSRSVIVTVYDAALLKLLMNDRVDSDSLIVCRRDNQCSL